MPAYNSFSLYKGDTLRFSLTLNTSGSAYVIPENTIFSGAIKQKGSSSPLVNFDSEITSNIEGTVLFTLNASDSSLLAANRNWLYDVQMKDLDGTVTTLMTGHIFVTDEVTP